MLTRAISRIATVVIILVIIVLAAGLGMYYEYYSPAQTRTSVSSLSVGYGGPPSCAGTTSLLLFVAEQIHAWDKYNLNVTLVNFPAGDAASLTALSNGQIQVDEANTETFGLELANGAPIKIFGQELIDGSWSLVVPANSSFTSVSQLKGSKITIATTSIGSTVWVENQLLGKAFGLQQGTDYVDQVASSVPTGYSLLQSGKVQAIMTPIPTAISFSQRQHFPIRFLANTSQVLPKPFIERSFISTNSYLQQNPSALVSFLNGFKDAYTYFANNATFSDNFISTCFGVSGSYATTIYNLMLGSFFSNPFGPSTVALNNVRTLGISAGVLNSTQAVPPASQWATNITSS